MLSIWIGCSHCVFFFIHWMQGMYTIMDTARKISCMFITVLICSVGLSGSRVPCKDTGLFPLVETQPCPCARYTLQPTGPWSDCLLEGEGVSTSVAANGRVALGVCGAGSRFRRSECLDADGNLVEPRYSTCFSLVRCVHCWIYR